MSRRPSLPGAAELFRSTGGGESSNAAPAPAPSASPTPAEGRRLARLALPREEVPDRGAGDRTAGERSASVRSLTGAAPAGEGLSDFGERAQADPSFHALRAPAAGFDDDGGGEPLRRASGRIRQTRRQSTQGGVDRRPSGRERHEEKITVYCSAEELFELERARLALRGDHGMVVDRGRIVREAVAVVLADLDAKGDSSILVRRLRES